MATTMSKTKAKAGTVSAAPAEAVVQESPLKQSRLVVCAYPGTGNQLARVWERMTRENPVLITVYPDVPLSDLLAEVLSRLDVADEFVLVPANCVPCAPISFEELKGPFVFVDIQGARHYSDRLPVYFTKAALMGPLIEDTKAGDEAFMKAYYKRNLHRPIEGGFRFGNLVTPVYRPNPCENVVIEAFVRKKFVTASPEGYKAIAHLVDQYLLG